MFGVCEGNLRRRLKDVKRLRLGWRDPWRDSFWQIFVIVLFLVSDRQKLPG